MIKLCTSTALPLAQKQTDTSTVALGTITISLMESTTEEISRRGEVVSSSQYGSEDSRKCGAEESLLFKTKVIFLKKGTITMAATTATTIITTTTTTRTTATSTTTTINLRG